MAWEDLSADISAEFDSWRAWSEADRDLTEEFARAAAKERKRETDRRYEARNRTRRNAEARAKRARLARAAELAKPVHNGRKTHCPKGHPYAGDNLVVWGDGRRRCVACLKAHKRNG